MTLAILTNVHQSTNYVLYTVISQIFIFCFSFFPDFIERQLADSALTYNLQYSTTHFLFLN